MCVGDYPTPGSFRSRDIVAASPGTGQVVFSSPQVRSTITITGYIVVIDLIVWKWCGFNGLSCLCVHIS